MSAREEIYLDYAASAPLDPAVLEVMERALRDAVANPSSTHAAGTRAARIVEAARERVAARIGAAPERLVFTSGATEANNLALKGVLEHALGTLDPRAARGAQRPHLVTSRIEHRSVLDAARALEARGVEVTYVASDAHGVVAPEHIAAAFKPATALVSLMHVNNETGAVQDVAAVAELCREHGVPLHVDAAQSVGKLPLTVAALGAVLVSLTAHKLCGPKGVGALYVAPGIALTPQLHGGEQERSLRAGTLAPHQAAGMGAAYELAAPAREAPRLAALRDRLAAQLRAIPGVRENGDPLRRAPHLLNVSFPGAEGESLRAALADVAVSAGSACAAASPEASHVLTGMGASDVLAASSLRFSVGRFTTEDEIDRAARRVATEVRRLRELAAGAPAWCSA